MSNSPLSDGKPIVGKKPTYLWKLLFFTIVAGYCLYYAPFGVNETDGGFLTGLAWQVLNGHVLYQDIVYVRPPLPVWLRALELQLLPENFAILGERWIFYSKVALYSWLAAATLARYQRRWQLAVLSFVVSAHCFPPVSWHTVDGILFATMAATPNPLRRRGLSDSVWAGVTGIFLFCALLCKQSFFPLLPLFAVFLFFGKENRWRKMAWFFGAFAVCTALFFNYLNQKNILSNFLRMTGDSASGGQAWQHGVLDYFRITPELALPSLVLLALVAWRYRSGKTPRLAWYAWLVWLFALIVSFAATTWSRQEYTAPIAQSRAMFWVAAAYGCWLLARLPRFGGVGPLRNWRPSTTAPSGKSNSQFPNSPIQPIQPIQPLLLLGICWCASVSWGYPLPILFATPWVWAGMEVARLLTDTAKPIRFSKPYRFGALIALLIAFRIGHEFVYRDGRRSEMTEPMGAIFPQLSGIYSDRETADLYRDLRQLAERYGPNFKTLPAFPQANFLTKSPPPLPLDWVVRRETNGDYALVLHDLKARLPVLFVQKSFREKIETDPELEFTRQVFRKGEIVEETPHFWVLEHYQLSMNDEN